MSTSATGSNFPHHQRSRPAPGAPHVESATAPASTSSSRCDRHQLLSSGRRSELDIPLAELHCTDPPHPDHPATRSTRHGDGGGQAGAGSANVEHRQPAGCPPHLEHGPRVDRAHRARGHHPVGNARSTTISTRPARRRTVASGSTGLSPNRGAPLSSRNRPRPPLPWPRHRPGSSSTRRPRSPGTSISGDGGRRRCGQQGATPTAAISRRRRAGPRPCGRRCAAPGPLSIGGFDGAARGVSGVTRDPIIRISAQPSRSALPPGLHSRAGPHVASSRRRRPG